MADTAVHRHFFFFGGGGACLNCLANKALSGDKTDFGYLFPRFELFGSTTTGMNKASRWSLLLNKDDNLPYLLTCFIFRPYSSSHACILTARIPETT